MNATVGLRLLEVEDRTQGVTFPVPVFHPAGAAEQPQHFGPYSIPAARDAEVVGDHLPVIIVSHGNTGSPWTHRGLAAHLARAGFVVALPEHLGNSASDATLTGTLENLQNRPRHIRLTIDALSDDNRLGPHLLTSRVGVIGHSIGAYTALAAAGGRPDPLPGEGSGPIEVLPDRRIAAVVLLAPAVPWFARSDALAAIEVPIMLRTGELDAVLPPGHAGIIERGIAPDLLVDREVVPGAGHFSFQDPFPSAMQSADFPPSQDPPGFDRQAYQQILCAEILSFLQRWR